MSTLKENIINALNNLHLRTGGDYFHLDEIYSEVSKIAERKDEQLKASIRGTMETNSSDSTSFNRKNSIFSLKTKGTGMWKLDKYDDRHEINLLAIGQNYTMNDIMRAFKVSGQRGMMKSNTHNCLVLISKNSNGTYDDFFLDDSTIIYTGEGQVGDQLLNNSNYTLYNSLRLGIDVYFFRTVETGKHKFYGEVYLCNNPYQVDETDREGNLRKVWKFPLKIKDSAIQFEESYKDNENYEYVLNTIEKLNDSLSLDKTLEEVSNIRADETPLNLRKFKPIEDRKKHNRIYAPDFVANEIIKDACGKLNEKIIYEMEIQLLMGEIAQEHIERMQSFFENKKENEGFDILSFEKDRDGVYVEKYIEVKSTKGGESTPIDITESELFFAEQHKDHYYIYRIINSDSKKRYLKIIAGDPRDKYRVEPTDFKIYAVD